MTKDHEITGGIGMREPKLPEESRLPDVERLIAESLRIRGSVAVRIEPRIFDLHSGVRGGYRSMRGQGFTLEIASAPAVYKTLRLLRGVIELGVPLEIQKCSQAHPPIWFHLGADCPVCVERGKVAVMRRAVQKLIESGLVEREAVSEAARLAKEEIARETRG